MSKNVLEPVSQGEIQGGISVLSGAKVFFGHQSVGWNLIEGLKDLVGPGVLDTLKFVETRTASDISGPGFYHAGVGENFNPKSKLKDFEALLRGGIGKEVDAAFLKFCYVDITSDTDVNVLFADYKASMSRLQAEFPGLRIVHFTAPLTARESSAKAAIKRMIGRKTSDQDNIAREAYNRLIRAEYGGKAPLFDLALAEASDGSGSAEPLASGSGEYYSLLPEYTDDGGHLNAVGRKRTAGFLAYTLGGLF